MKLEVGRRVVWIPDYSTLSEEKKELWLEWIWALRIGDFHQVDGLLHTEKGFCAFGVATEINKERLGGYWLGSLRPIGGVHYYDFWSERDDHKNQLTGVSCTLPVKLGRMLGFDKSPNTGFTVRLEGVDRGLTLNNLNDNFKATFRDIAMILELALHGGYGNDERSDSMRVRGEVYLFA